MSCLKTTLRCDILATTLYCLNIPRLKAVLRHDVECLDTALSHGVLAIHHKPTRYIIAIINWLPT